MKGVIVEPKQNKLTFDTTPTEGSNNPVTSDGVAKGIKQSTALDEYVVAGGLILRKFGKVCVLNGYYTWSSTQSGEVIIATLPAGYRPKHPVRTLANIGSNAWSYGRTAYFTVADNGNIVVLPADNNGYAAVFASCSWVLA